MAAKRQTVEENPKVKGFQVREREKKNTVVFETVNFFYFQRRRMYS